MAPIKVKQELYSSEAGATEEIPTEILAQSIVDLAAGIRKIMSGRLTEKALLLLIQNACPGEVAMKDIKAVFAGLDELEKLYIKPKRAP